MNTLTLITHSPEETEALGRALGRCLRPGDTVLLRGEMGAGKSVLTRAAARGMGIAGAVPSPTFTLLNIHQGTALKLYHFDLYRLEDADALYEAGLDEFIPPEDGAALIEWPEMAEEAMPPDRLTVTLVYAEDGEAREITLTPGGAFDTTRVEAILNAAEELK